jgi:hypothetical protein
MSNGPDVALFSSRACVILSETKNLWEQLKELSIDD